MTLQGRGEYFTRGLAEAMHVSTKQGYGACSASGWYRGATRYCRDKRIVSLQVPIPLQIVR